MKKIFLLSLLSVLLLSAFSQTSNEKPEIIAKINISTSMTDEEGAQSIERGIWIFFYKYVTTTYLPGGGIKITCSGWGLKFCIPHARDLQNGFLTANPELIDQIFEELITESNELIAQGKFEGSISKKVLISSSYESEKDYYLLFLMNWKTDPEKPYNGQAEIIISKTNKLGF
ncbi:MAG: hypothetical protein FWF70_05280 [Bacteroidetes bacterium]|nr:hypothetical protein [Bacteroidota bacterium]MCL1969378.1 hypothetical protein [Bacteroidota bacterium]